jgi:hypothetical protein
LNKIILVVDEKIILKWVALESGYKDQAIALNERPASIKDESFLEQMRSC